MIRGLWKTMRELRAIRSVDLRDAIDDALRSAGYGRRPSGIATALPIVGAFGAGFAVGTGVGVLFAPKSGVETRAELKRRMDTFVDKVKQAGRTTNGKSTIITDEHELRGPIETS